MSYKMVLLILTKKPLKPQYNEQHISHYPTHELRMTKRDNTSNVMMTENYAIDQEDTQVIQ